MTAVVNETRAGAPGKRSYFYVWMAVICAAVAFIGFAPTYWAPMTQGAFVGSPVVHLHGAIFFGWTLFVIYQTWLVASGKTAHHRETGMIGIVLVTAMVIFGMMTAIKAVLRAPPEFVDDAKAFLIVPVTGILLFGIIVAFAIANVRRPEWHKRLLLIGTIAILEAAIARWFLTFLAPPPVPGVTPNPVPPVEVATGPGIVADLLIVAAMIYDWRMRGRVHPAYLIAGGAVLAVQVARIPLSDTPFWRGVADWLVALAR